MNLKQQKGNQLNISNHSERF